MKKKRLRDLINEKRKAYDAPEEEEDDTVSHRGGKTDAEYVEEAMTYVDSNHSTVAIASADMRRIAGMVSQTPAAPATFETLPAGSSPVLHRIVLAGTTLKAFSLGIGVAGDVVLGCRVSDDINVDVDLLPITDGEYGISRRHALLRPSNNKLFLLDLNSTNGTRVNGGRVYPSRAMLVNSGDMISLGKLTMTLTIEK